MSTIGGQSLGAGGSRPWIWVVIPLGIVIFVGGLACTCHTFLRRRRKAHMLQLDPRGRRALEQDLENAAVRGSRGGARLYGQRWVRPTTRWAWANNINIRGEEGLNELGEAPPPYDAKKADHNNKNEEVELQAMGARASQSSRQEAESGSARVAEPPAYTSAPQPPAAIHPSMNHRYG